MRRTIITAVASVALAVPGIALASHQGEHQLRDDHGVHHKRHHARHHHHAHIVTFGAAASSAPAGVSGTASPMSPGDDTAGTIASFSNGTLTITLNDGSSVSGKVTSFTEIECRSSMAAAASHGGRSDDNGQGDDNDQGDDRGQDGQSNSAPVQSMSGQSQSSSGNGGQDDGPGHDEGDDNGQDEAEHCTTTALVTGAVVREAELSVSSAGSVWKKVELNA
ncbi:MAG: hypothetical protein ACYDHT_07080 [Solirubrobacteraceae bacterium]